jgi:hypothetical protein
MDHIVLKSYDVSSFGNVNWFISGAILGYNSKLTLMVFDPKNEPQGKFKASLPPQMPPTDTRKPTPIPSPRFVC